jgi:hypothetical protein
VDGAVGVKSEVSWADGGASAFDTDVELVARDAVAIGVLLNHLLAKLLLLLLTLPLICRPGDLWLSVERRKFLLSRVFLLMPQGDVKRRGSKQAA